MKYCHKYDCKWNIQSVCEWGESCMNDLISRKQAIKLIQKINDEHDSVYAISAIHDVVNGIEQLPSVNPQANRENIHREREQAYMKGYEDASKRYRTEPCEDAISRQAAIDAMATWDWQELYLPIHFKQLLEDLPSVSTEKTGRWIYKTMKGQFCSICDEQSVWKFKYCPNCGAKMVEPQESEDVDEDEVEE